MNFYFLSSAAFINEDSRTVWLHRGEPLLFAISGYWGLRDVKFAWEIKNIKFGFYQYTDVCKHCILSTFQVTSPN